MASYHRALSARERVALDWLDLPVAPPLPETLCCDGFRRGVFAASVADPSCCVRCAAARRAEAQAARYAWRVVSFGRIRRVPAHEAQRWP